MNIFFQNRLSEKLKIYQSLEKKRYREIFNSSQNKALNFSGSDYLGLSQSEAIKNTIKKSVESYGLDFRASQVVSGFSEPQKELEEKLAHFLGLEKVLIYNNGSCANFDLLTAILKPTDYIFADRNIHASLYDGIIHSKASLIRYRHLDVHHLKKLIQKNLTSSNLSSFIISDGLFSMDGDEAFLSELLVQAHQSSSILIIDDAHGIGVLGENGKGIIDGQHIKNENFILTGSLSKAFGCLGGFVAGSASLIELLIQSSRSIRYSTALPAILFEAALTSLKMIQEEPWRREKLNALISFFKKQAQELNLPLLDSSSPIQGLIISDIKKLLAVGQGLKEKGYWVGVIRPPSVLPGQSRLRITLSALHEEQDIKNLLIQIEKLSKENNVVFE